MTASVSAAGAGTARGVAAADPSVVLDHVTAAYGSRIALDDVSLQVGAGSLLAVIGPNGAGKSTLLKLIAGVLKPEAGTVRVLGAPAGVHALPPERVPQQSAQGIGLRRVENYVGARDRHLPIAFRRFSAVALGLTLYQASETLPFSSTRNAERMMPMYVRP